MRKVTIKDIGRKLDMHHSTVSRALRGHPDISPKTRKMVVAMAEELNYTPNQAALALRGEPSNTIAVAMPELNHFGIRTLVNELADNLRHEGIHVTVSIDELHQLDDYKRLYSGNPRAAILFSFVSGNRALIEQNISKLNQRLMVVEIDYITLLIETIDTLVKQNKRKLALAVGSAQSEKLQATFKEYLLEHFIPFLGQDFKTGINSVEEGACLARTLLKSIEKPDAIIFASADAAIGFHDIWSKNPRSLPIAVASLEHAPTLNNDILCCAHPFTLDTDAISQFLLNSDENRSPFYISAF